MSNGKLRRALSASALTIDASTHYLHMYVCTRFLPISIFSVLNGCWAKSVSRENCKPNNASMVVSLIDLGTHCQVSTCKRF
jgi:hypothetical protein